MPKELEERLKKRAITKFPNDPKKQDAYVYGTMRKIGWKPRKEGV